MNDPPPLAPPPRLVASYELPRRAAMLVGVGVGVLIGIGNAYLDVVWPSTPEILAWLVAALVVVTVLHEALHGLAGRALGHDPVFGVQPPLVFTTFHHRIPRNHLIVIALAPLLVLDGAAVALYATGRLQLFAILCFAVNTIGALGDLWIVSRLARHRPDEWVQDTKSGVEVWSAPGPAAPEVVELP